MNLEQIDTSTTAGKGLIDAARAALPFIAYAFDQGIDGAEEAGRAIEEALRDDQLQGYVLVPVEPTEEMLDAGRAAVMAEHCAGPKWTPRQHFEASGRSTAGIPEDVLDERGPLTKESTAAMVFGAMLAARPEVSNVND
jgi:hypothetical protein